MDKAEKTYIFLYDAIASPDFLRRLNGEGPYKDYSCSISRSEIEKAERFCTEADPKSLTAALTRIGLRLLREKAPIDKQITIAENDGLKEVSGDPIYVTNQDGVATILQSKYGIKTERFNHSLKPYTGFVSLELTTDQIAQWHTNGFIAAPPSQTPFQFAVFSNDGNSTYGSVGKKSGSIIVPLDHRTIKPSGITPHSDWQLIMNEILLDKSRPISVIGARAGAGKTLFATACALHLRSTNAIRHIIYVPPINKEPPVPGGPEEKIAPYVYGLRDALWTIDIHSHGSNAQTVKTNLGVHFDDLNVILEKYTTILNRINDLDFDEVTEALTMISNHIATIRPYLYQNDQSGAEDAPTSASKEIIEELRALFLPLAEAEKGLLSLRQGNMKTFLRTLTKSVKEAQKSINAILSPTAKSTSSQTDIIKKYGIEVMSAIQLRSRSLADTYVIVDEAQFLNLPQIDALGSRASTNSHITFLGDARQTYDIDSHDVMNGMLILSQTQMTSARGSVLIVPPTVRSERKDSADFIASLEGVSTTSIAKSML